MARIMAGLLLGLALGCAAWAVDGEGPSAVDRAQRVFTARWQAMRLDDGVVSHRLPMDACGACLGLCRDMDDDYGACAERCRQACGLGRAAAWADAD